MKVADRTFRTSKRAKAPLCVHLRIAWEDHAASKESMTLSRDSALPKSHSITVLCKVFDVIKISHALCICIV